METSTSSPFPRRVIEPLIQRNLLFSPPPRPTSSNPPADVSFNPFASISLNSEITYSVRRQRVAHPRRLRNPRAHSHELVNPRLVRALVNIPGRAFARSRRERENDTWDTRRERENHSWPDGGNPRGNLSFSCTKGVTIKSSR